MHVTPPSPQPPVSFFPARCRLSAAATASSIVTSMFAPKSLSDMVRGHARARRDGCFRDTGPATRSSSHHPGAAPASPSNTVMVEFILLQVETPRSLGTVRTPCQNTPVLCALQHAPQSTPSTAQESRVQPLHLC